MKNTLYFFIVVLFLSSCVVTAPTVTYEKTNASLIQKSIKDLNALENLKSHIKKSDKITVVGV